MTPIHLKAGQNPKPVRAGICVRTQLKVGPSNFLDRCDNCKDDCNNKPLPVIKGCIQDCQDNVCD
jgi:hypothetical protein